MFLDIQNVLLTTCEDGEMRIWIESEKNEKLQFTILHSCFIGIKTKVDWVTVNFDLHSKNVSSTSSDLNKASNFHYNLPNTSRHTDIREFSRMIFFLFFT